MSKAIPATAARGHGQKVGWFARELHRNYSRGAALNFFFSRRIRPAGIGLFIVLVLATGLGFGHPRRSSVYQIFSLSAGMGLIALPWAISRRVKLSAKRELPRYATVGEHVRYTIRVTNTGKRSVSRAWISETSIDPRPTPAEFANRREPGEEKRNWFDRKTAYYRWQWLLTTKRGFDGGGSRDMLQIAPGESVRVAAELTPLKRGVIRLNDLRVFLPDPFGLFQSCRKVPSSPATLTVLPKRYLLPTLEMPGSSRFQTGDETATNAIGYSGEFVGLRDYRPGDPLRQIHWKSWARTGRPIVKELEDTYYPRYGLVLDTFLNSSNDGFFEEALSVSASFVAMIDRGESLLDLMFVKDEAHVVTAGRGLARTEKLLDVLAGVEGDETENFEDLSQLVLRHREELTSCLVVLVGWDEARAGFVKSLARGGIACAPIIIGEGPKPPHVPGYWLESGQIERDLLSLPRRLQTTL